ncbi:NADPH oxidase 4-like [Choristoneura fumiferana]|uniref:NADPH oxidase 4-like n=1 Tax=Choristoneura fumiferana TaxID=7141 RepID=UPI003D159A01
MAIRIRDCYDFLTRRFFLISWISLVIYLFYTTFIFYKTSRRFYYLRELLGIGLCISRGTATVLNICCALVLLPLCKKLNQLLYRILSKLCPGLFFFWLEKAKSFHMTVAITLVIFAVIHSTSHFVNLWNFSRNYDETLKEINLANYKNENPLMLLMSPAGLTGVTMLVITLTMALTSMRIVRQKVYNAFWYTHQLYMPFMVLLIVHPLSGVLKEEIFVEKRLNYIDKEENNDISRIHSPVFVPIQSKTWIWMALPLICFFLDLLWRILSRNRTKVDIIRATHMARRTISLTLSCHEQFSCRAGQYVLLQCQEVSRLEWHPFTVVKVPTSSQRNFIVWIRVKGDWTDALERLLLQKGSDNLNILVDGPFSSPMEGVRRSRVAVCVAAGVGITPFVATLHDMLLNPRKLLPGRVHLLWIVRHERELTWLAELATEVLSELRSANRPDRLQLELYITNSDMDEENKKQNTSHVVEINERGSITHVVTNGINDEKVTLLTPNRKRRDYLNIAKCESVRADYNLAKEFPLLACRAKPGRPHWDRLFGYWVHLYPEDHLNVYCCGPKTLVKMLRCKCKSMSRGKTKFTFVHEGFS